MKCEVEWLRITTDTAWEQSRKSGVRHHNTPEMKANAGQRQRKRPDDFDTISAIIPAMGKLMEYYHAGHSTILRWQGKE